MRRSALAALFVAALSLPAAAEPLASDDAAKVMVPGTGPQAAATDSVALPSNKVAQAGTVQPSPRALASGLSVVPVGAFRMPWQTGIYQ